MDAVGRAPFSRFGFHPYGAGGLDYIRYSPTAAGNHVAATQRLRGRHSRDPGGRTQIGDESGFGVERKLRAT